MPVWEKEEAFRTLLHKIAAKATSERLATASDLALENDEAAVKHVSGLVLKELKQLKSAYKLRIFYAFSSIVRASVAKYGSRSKYAARWGVKLDTIAGLLAEIPPNDKIQVGRVLQLWWRDGIFPPSALTRLQAIFPAPAAPNTASHSKKSGAVSKQSASGGSSEEKKNLQKKYWDADLGAEVFITSTGKHDAPASPQRDGLDNPAQEPSPVDDASPLPEVAAGGEKKMNSSHQAPVFKFSNHVDEINEDFDEEDKPRPPKRRMLTLQPNRNMNI
jgi:hypothetical protein